MRHLSTEYNQIGPVCKTIETVYVIICMASIDFDDII